MEKGKFSFMIVSILLILLLFIVSTKSAGSPIGYEYVDNNQFLHTWNQNPLGEDRANIWQNVSADYSQFFNGETLEEGKERAEWLKNKFSIGYYLGDDFIYLSQNHLNDPEVIIESDEETYWDQLIYNCKDINNNSFCAGWIRGQELYSEYMENSFFWNFTGAIQPTQQLYYVWKFEDIQIENDDVTDHVIYCYMKVEEVFSENITYEKCDFFMLDNPNTFEQENLTQFYIRDPFTRRGHNVIWNDTTNVRLRYEGDGDVMLLSPIKDLSAYDEINMWWIDAESDQLAPDNVLNQSGWIQANGTIPIIYKVIKNANPEIGKPTATSRDRGFLSYNLSSIPNGANVTSVSFYNKISETTETEPDSWRNKYYTYTYEIKEDDGGLWASGASMGDWNDGNYTGILVTWTTVPECSGSNAPCDSWIVLGKNSTDTAVRDAQWSIDNDEWFGVKIEDSSLFSGGQTWDATWWLSTGVRISKIEINYTKQLDNESEARQAILEGINNIIPTSTKYQDQQIYTAALDGNQTVGYFDIAAILSDQTWAFNYLTGSDSYTNLNPLLHIVNVWENESLFYNEIVAQVETFINDTEI